MNPTGKSPTPSTCLAILELDGKDVTPIWRANAFWTSRRPRGPKLDVAILQAWLKTARETDELQKFSLDTEGSSLQKLILLGCFRVVDVTTRQVVALSKFEPYLALSYVWGRASFAAMIRHDQSQDAPRSDLLEACWTLDIDPTPKTIRDAMSLVQQLGYRYLWADSLCIDQESPTEKSAVIHEMRSIYRSASLTIVAAEGDTADAGLRRLTSQDEAERPLVIPQGGRSLNLYPALPSLEETIKATIWNERGWTFQERVLSNACVYFTRDEVLFSSGGIVERESYVITNNPDRPLSTYRRKTPSIGKQATLQGALSQPILDLDHNIHRYKEAITEFTRRKSTHRGDRLDALTGILTLLENGQTEQEIQALSGLLHSRSLPNVDPRLESPFLMSLLWYPKTPVTSDERIPHNAMRTRALPSWSWAGWACEVHFENRLVRPCDSTSPIIVNENNIQCTNPSDQPLPDWPYKPSPSALTVREAFVLHLWRPVIQASLKPHGGSLTADLRKWNTYQIILPTEHHAQKQLCLIDVSHEFTQSRPEDHLYEFIPVEYGAGAVFDPRNVLLVRRRDEYHERIAFSWGTPLWFPTGKQVRCQHVKLI